MVKENIFSHVDLYSRPKLVDKTSDLNSKKTFIHNVASITGRTKPIWVVGILTQREDTHFYLEDDSISIRVRLDELDYVDPNCYITENQVLLCNGVYKDEKFVVRMIEQPPLHGNKSLRFKVHESDYFGAYGKMQRELTQTGKKGNAHFESDLAFYVNMEDG